MLQKLLNPSNWYKEPRILAFFIFVDIAFAVWLTTLPNSFLINVGFLIIGGLITMTTVLISDEIKRRSQAEDLARALYVELADRAARCCFDCEAPWNAYLGRNNYVPGTMDFFRLRKFSPIPPLIYSATAIQIAILKGDAPQALIHFYVRLERWQRDIENIAAKSQENKGGVAPDDVHLLAIRAHETLEPGLRALQALSPMVDGHEQIEAVAIAGYDKTRGSTPAKASLQQRIRKLIEQSE